MIVNFTHLHQYQSLLTLPGSTSPIERTFQTKLLGYWLTMDMKPDTHVAYMLKIAYSRLWSITRLKAAGVSDDDIFYFFTVKIRSVLEFSAPIFTSMLSEENISDIERIQKIVFRVILTERYTDYESACILMNAKSLKMRRSDLSLSFALNCLKTPQHQHLFKERKSLYYTLRNIKSFEEPLCLSERYKCSPLPFLTRLLNEHFSRK